MLFRNTLVNWYLENCRPLPWRTTNDPYAIWVSEIILQQTRVNQGLAYYHRFISRFPDIQSLANASEELVLKTWEGLGYYSRARNMHATARFLVESHNGNFPEDFKELEKLKGIGKYTAAAIASIAFNKPVAVVDGNVLRFVSRYLGISQPIDSGKTINNISSHVNELISADSPGLFNQAMMEFGALQCVPVKPDCNKCPFANDCKAYKEEKVAVIPYKEKKTGVTARFFNYLVVQHYFNDFPGIVLRHRNHGDIWKHLYDFPLIETNKLLSIDQLRSHDEFMKLFDGSDPVTDVYPGSYRHLLTHRIIHARFFKILLGKNDSLRLPDGYISTNNPTHFPMPVLIKKFIEEQDLKTLLNLMP
ncbi:MAG: A/G-specific adenine glycosylase [Bacteroidales bacterium]|nr:A/G-specific adenine glycosylase [Bacteroidales bacterium]